MAQQNTDYYDTNVPARRSEVAWDDLSLRIYNPLNLSSATVSVLHDLADARISSFNAVHLVQEQTPCLIRRRQGTPYTLIYVPLRGAVEWRSGEKSWTARPGQLIVSGARQPQEALSLEDSFEVISIHVHIQLPGTMPDHSLFTEMVHDLPGSCEFWHKKLDLVTTFYQESAFAEMTANILRMLLVELVLNGAELTPYPRVTDSRVKQAMELIRRQVGNRDVLSEASRITQTSGSHLRLLFRRQLGISPKAYHQDVRRYEVVRLLNRPELSIKEVAAQCGYANQQHLESDFKKKYGVAPGKFRKAL